LNPQNKSFPDRKQLRLELREKRRSLGHEVQVATGKQVAEIALHQDTLPIGQHIALYMAADGEVSTLSLLDALLAMNKQCYLPVLEEETTTLQFRQFLPEAALVTNRFGLLEPDSEAKVINANELDNVFMPLVGFDEQGNRLGMGKGYYDRSFAFLMDKTATGPVLIGLAHECQRVESLEAANWDVPLVGIITGQQMYLVG